jgi:hypothetical protein
VCYEPELICIADVTCKDDDGCSGDTYCQGGRCIPYGKGPRSDRDLNCARAIPVGLVAPRISCEWLGPAAGDAFPNHKQVLSTPLVIDFNFDDHLSAEIPTSRPSIVVNTYDALDGECGTGEKYDGANYGILRILDGRSCKLQYTIPTHVNGAVTPAVGDINGDGRPDILAVSVEGGLVAFGYNKAQDRFTTLWTSKDTAGAPSTPVAGKCQWASPALHDLNDDGKPEALLEGYVYDSTGKLIDSSLGLLSIFHNGGQFPVVADVDRDGSPNLATPRFLLGWDRGQSRWVKKQSFDEFAAKGVWDFAAVADFGIAFGKSLDRTRRDGLAEVVVVSNGRAAVLSLEGKMVFGPIILPGSMGTGGGPPTVGDFDNDGRPEFAAAGESSFTIFDPDCVLGAREEHCPSKRTDGILWTSRSQDVSSNTTGSAVFDFDGDGNAEAIYADECYVRIYDGRNGDVLFSQPHSSCTWHEYPVVADAGGQFRSKLIVPSNQSCPQIVKQCPATDPVFQGLRCKKSTDCPSDLPCDFGLCRCTSDAQCNSSVVGGGYTCLPPPSGVSGSGKTCQATHNGTLTGIRVYSDVSDRWVSSRPLWSSHTYSITEIQDNGILPRTSEVARNWEQQGLNNYRMNIQGKVRAGAVADLTLQGAAPVCQAGGVELRARLCNRGTAPVEDGVPVTFREGAAPLCTARTKTALVPGTCVDVSCLWSGAKGTHAVDASADDAGEIIECHEGNGKVRIQVSC